MDKTNKAWLLAFAYAFILNYIWENAHRFLYISYRGSEITQFVLIRATFVDAIVISAMIIIISLYKPLKKKPWIIALTGIIVAVIIEKWALYTNRWMYKESMPIIPLINAGLTPTIQLAITGYLVYLLVKKNAPAVIS